MDCARLARLVSAPNPSWEIGEATADGALVMQPGERRRGPVRGIVWLTLKTGTAKLLGLDPTFIAGEPPLPLTSGIWIEAGESECTAIASTSMPDFHPPRRAS